MYGTLLDRIASILRTNAKIQEVHTFEAGEFKGTPAATITPTGNESDYLSTNLNERIYSFSVRLFVNRKVYDKTGNESERVIRELADTVIDSFDRDYYFEGLTVPEGYCMINVFALPSQWGYSGREDEYRVAEVIVKCRVAVDVTRVGN